MNKIASLILEDEKIDDLSDVQKKRLIDNRAPTPTPSFQCRPSQINLRKMA